MRFREIAEGEKLNEFLALIGWGYAGDCADAVARENIFKSERFGLAKNVKFGLFVGYEIFASRLSYTLESASRSIGGE